MKKSFELVNSFIKIECFNYRHLHLQSLKLLSHSLKKIKKCEFPASQNIDVFSWLSIVMIVLTLLLTDLHVFAQKKKANLF